MYLELFKMYSICELLLMSSKQIEFRDEQIAWHHWDAPILFWDDIFL